MLTNDTDTHWSVVERLEQYQHALRSRVYSRVQLTARLCPHHHEIDRNPNTVASAMNTRYQELTSTNVYDVNWVQFGGIIEGNGATYTVLDLLDRTARFYRVVMLP